MSMFISFVNINYFGCRPELFIIDDYKSTALAICYIAI